MVQMLRATLAMLYEKEWGTAEDREGLVCKWRDLLWSLEYKMSYSYLTSSLTQNERCVRRYIC